MTDSNTTPRKGESNELKPCPFCGGTWIGLSSDPPGQREAGCGNCMASAPDNWWNTRASSHVGLAAELALRDANRIAELLAERDSLRRREVAFVAELERVNDLADSLRATLAKAEAERVVCMKTHYGRESIVALRSELDERNAERIKAEATLAKAEARVKEAEWATRQTQIEMEIQRKRADNAEHFVSVWSQKTAVSRDRADDAEAKLAKAREASLPFTAKELLKIADLLMGAPVITSPKTIRRAFSDRFRALAAMKEVGPCAACGGTEVQTVDRFDPIRGHTTDEVPCQLCAKEGNDGR